MLAHKTSNVDLQSLAIQFNIEQLEFRMQFNDLRWLHGLLNSKRDCPHIIDLTNKNVPNKTLFSYLQA